MSQRTIIDLINEGQRILEDKNIENARFEAEVILMNILKYNKSKLILNYKECIEDAQVNRFIEYINIRLTRKPLQYIIGNQEFMGLQFEVNEDVLIPRQDTEVLVESVLQFLDNSNATNVMDICTGSGCIPISLCYYNKDIKCVGIDISSKALTVARKNAIYNKVEDRIDFINNDLIDNYESQIKYDVIISNPPYIRTSDMDTLMTEVKDYEPSLALDGGEDGLIFYRRISEDASKYLAEGGKIFFEVGYDQAYEVSSILKQYGYKDIEIVKDLCGINRVVIANYYR